MKKFILALAALVCCSTTQAENIALYKHTISVSRTGAGTATTTRYTGWMVTHLNGGEFCIIRADAKRLRFTVDEPASWNLQTITKPLGLPLLSLTIDSGELTGLKAKGNTQRKEIFPTGNFWNLPGSMTISGSDTFQLTGTDWYLDEYKGTFLFDAINTKLVNNANDDYETVKADVKQYFLNKGYQEEVFVEGDKQ